MSLPIKIAIGTVGSGAVAVSGYEVVSYATGKDGLFISGASKGALANPSPTNNEQQQNAPVTVSKKQKVLDLIKKADFKCTVKVWIDNEDKGVNDIDEEEKLNGLFEHLDGIKDTTCGASVSPNKLLVLKKSDSNDTWAEINEADQIKALVNGFNGKCTIKIKTESSEYKNVTGDLGNTSIGGLYEKVKALKTECSNGNPEKTIIFKKDNSNWTPVDDQGQIEYLVGQTSFKCEVKVKTDTNGSADAWKTAVSDADELKKLLTKLESIKNTECGTSVTKTPKKELVLLKAGSGAAATFSTDKERVDSWKTSKSGTCNLKIRDSSGNRDIQDGDDLSGLIDFLNKDTTTSACTAASSKDPKEIVVQRNASNSWEIYLTDKQKVDKWIEGKDKFKNKKCVLKIYSATGNKEISENENLTGLSEHLTSNSVESQCTNDTQGSSQEVVVKYEGSTWKVMSEHDQIKDLVAAWKDKCTIQIKTSGDGTPTTVDSNTEATTVKGLLKNLREVTGCPGEETKTLIFQKSGDSSTWNKVDSQ